MLYNDIDSYSAEYDFMEWSCRSIIADCLRKLRYKELASCVLKPGFDQDFIKECVTLVNHEANFRMDDELIHQLARSGLLSA